MDGQETQTGMRVIPILTLSVSFFCIAAFIFPGAAACFVYDRQAILKGELWRLLSCHWVHFNGLHLLYNLLAFIPAGIIVERIGRRRLLFLHLLSALFISTALFLLKPHMLYYGGLSGIAICLIYYCALTKMKEQHWRTICIIVIIGLPIKAAVELYGNSSILPYFGPQPFITMPVSHIVGILTGAIFYFFEKYQRPTKRAESGL